MTVYRDKLLGSICPIYIAHIEILAIAYESTVELVSSTNNLVWRNTFTHRIISLNESDEDNVIYISIENGKIFKLNGLNLNIIEVFSYDCYLINCFITNSVVFVTDEKILFFDKFEKYSMQIVGKNEWNHIDINNESNLIIMTKKRKIYASLIGMDLQKLFNFENTHHHLGDITCISVQQTKESKIFATGHVTGKIRIWLDFFNDTNLYTDLHWHFLSVSNIAWALEGEFLISGGLENVLLKWRTSDKEIGFYPRVDGHIRSLRAEKNQRISQFITVALLDDNSVIVLNEKFNEIIMKYRGFGQRCQQVHNLVKKISPSNPIGLIQGENLPDHLKGCLIANANEGKLQFIDPLKYKVNVHDVTCENWPVPQKNNMSPRFNQVTHTSVSKDGLFLVTVEKTIPLANEDMRIFEWTEKAENNEIIHDWVLRKKIPLMSMGVNGISVLPGANSILLISNDLKVWIYSRIKFELADKWVLSNTLSVPTFIPLLKPMNHGPALITHTTINGTVLIIVAKYKYICVWNLPEKVNTNTFGFCQEPLFYFDITYLKPQMTMSGHQKNLLVATIYSISVLHPDEDETKDKMLTMIVGCQTGFVMLNINLSAINFESNSLSKRVKPTLISASITKAPVTSIAISPDNKVAMTVPKFSSLLIVPMGETPNNQHHFSLDIPATSCAWVPLNDSFNTYGVACLHTRSNNAKARLSITTLKGDESCIEWEKPTSFKTLTAKFQNVDDAQGGNLKKIFVSKPMEKIKLDHFSHHNWHCFDV